MKKKNTIIISIIILIAAPTILFARPLINYLNKERAHIKEKSKAVALGYYLPSFEQLAAFVKNPSDEIIIDDQSYINYYQKAIETYPHLVNAPAMLGFFHARSGQQKEAIDFYQKAVSVNPHFFWNHYNLALVHFKEGNYQESILSVKEALEKRPEAVLLVVNKSPVYKQIWRYISDIEQQIVKNYKSGYEDTYALLVLNLYRLENYGAVLSACVSAIKSDFESKDFFNFYAGLSALKLGQGKEAVFFFQQVLKNNPRHAPTLYHLGALLKASGQNESSLSMLKQAQILENANGKHTPKESKISLRIF